MDDRCTAIYNVPTFATSYVNYYMNSIPKYLPHSYEFYCVYLASSLNILQNIITEQLTPSDDGHSNFHPITSTSPPVVIGIKKLQEEIRHDDIVPFIRLKPKNYLIYIDFTTYVACKIVGRNIDNHSFRKVIADNGLNSVSIYRLVYRVGNSNVIFTRTVCDIEDVYRILNKILDAIYLYKFYVLNALPYCMIHCKNLDSNFVSNVVEECNLNYDDVLRHYEKLI